MNGRQNVTRSGFDLFNGRLEWIDWAEQWVDASRAPRRDGVAKVAAYLREHGGNVLVVECATNTALSCYGSKPATVIAKWRAYMMPGVVRGAA